MDIRVLFQLNQSAIQLRLSRMGFLQISLPRVLPDGSSLFTPFFGTGGIRAILIAAENGSEDEAADQESPKKADDKNNDEGEGSWDRIWDAPQLG